MKELENILKAYQDRYPAAQISDHIKLLYQNEFGCRRLLERPEGSFEQLKAEMRSAVRGRQLFEDIGNDFYRLHLRNAAELGASPETLYRIMQYTAEKRCGTRSCFEEKLALLARLCQEKKLPFSPSVLRLYLMNYSAAGYPPVHHSTEFKEAYAPAYRVIDAECARLFELFLRIDRTLRAGVSPILVAVDGPCAAGKTTLAALLQSLYDCNVFHTDDFYLRPAQKTPERLAEPGGNMDRERLTEEILLPILEKRPVVFHRYSCKTGMLSAAETVPFKQLNIIEGSYALHPELRRFYQIKVVLDLSPAHQLSRLKRRESRSSMELFEDRWIPLENAYAKATDLFLSADLVYHTDE